MKICLSMIVKNEEHCIARCLESVKPYINYWIISDTGSTDKTEEIVKETLKDIPGEFHKNVWVDFSTNRNIALDLARDKSDYILFIDADDSLVVNKKNCFEKLNRDAYNIKINHSNAIYHRISLIKNSLPAKYEGILHESLHISNNVIAPPLLDGCHIKFGGDGCRSKDPEKYLKDALVLEKALEKDPNNSRYVFYCAQSYKDAKILDKAAKYYSQRTTMGGWNEECFFAAFELGKILESITPLNIINISNAYIKAFNFAPHRVESLTALCSFLRKHKLYDMAYFYSKIGIKIPKPNNGLFILPHCYDWKIKDEFALAAYYIKNYKAAYETNSLLLSSPNLPPSELSRIKQNLEFCKTKI
jgi:glycosyltransferase involved in cell wall biosynthesis